MPLTQLAPPYPIFTDKNGDPLDAGYLYFGVVNLNPETNPIQVYYDSAFTQPAAQPLRTSNGYVMRNGSPALLFAGSQFSVTVRNKNNELVIYSPVGYGIDPASISGTVIYDDFTGDGVTTVFVLTASPSTKNATNVYIDGIYQSKDNYNTNGSTLTFTTAPPLLSAIEVVTQESSIIGGASSQQITYNQGGAGAVTRTVQSRLRDFVSVKDFGAVGDGVTDDTAAIQAALDSTAKAIIFNENCTFLVTSQLTTTVTDRSIFGYGSTITTDGSIGAANNVLLVSGTRTTVAGLKITGIAGTTLCSAIFIGGVASVTVQDCRIFDFDNGTGIGANSSGTSHVIQNNYLDNCAPVSFGGLQYGSIACNASKSVITGNRILRNDLTGISVFGGDYVTISDNYIEGTGSLATVGGIILDGLTIGCVIDGNTINTGDVEGIQIAGSTTTYGGASKDHIISNNTILNSDYSAITLYGAQANSVINVTISGNHIKSVGTTGRGIELNRVSKINITGNYVYGYDVGLNVVNASPDVNLTGNFFESQTTTGIQIYGAKWNVSGNKVIGNGSTTTGMIFNGSAIAGEQMISGNQISDCAVGINGTFSGSARTYIYCNHFVDNTTNYSLTSQTTNSVNYNTFDASLSGTATLSSGTVTVNIAALAAEDKIVITQKTPSGTVGAAYVSSRTNGAGFVISSTSAGDNSTYTWELVR